MRLGRFRGSGRELPLLPGVAAAWAVRDPRAPIGRRKPWFPFREGHLFGRGLRFRSGVRRSGQTYPPSIAAYRPGRGALRGVPAPSLRHERCDVRQRPQPWGRVPWWRGRAPSLVSRVVQGSRSSLHPTGRARPLQEAPLAMCDRQELGSVSRMTGKRRSKKFTKNDALNSKKSSRIHPRLLS